MKPTEAQVKEFWEWCGWRYGIDDTDPVNPDGLWFPPKSTCCRQPLPAIDLNDLFKHAVPKLEKGLELTISLHRCHGNLYGCLIETCFGEVSNGTAETPALALFWAIWEAKQKGQTWQGIRLRGED